MKVGLSSYSLLDEINAGNMTILDAIDWVAASGGEHMELVPYGYTVVDNVELADRIKAKAADAGIELSGYSFPADLCQETPEAFRDEVERIKRHIDIAHRMGITSIRHDVTAFRLPPEHTSIHYYNRFFQQMVEGCGLLADYAAPYGVVTTIENHGFNVQASDRVQSLLHAVGRDNFKTTLDIGNFLCADEDPLIGVRKNIAYANRVHYKDFYVRPYYENPGEGKWFITVGQNYLRGAIIGHGDLPIREITRQIKSAGYDGYITVEFEGMEDCRTGSRIGMANVKRLWEEAGN